MNLDVIRLVELVGADNYDPLISLLGDSELIDLSHEDDE